MHIQRQPSSLILIMVTVAMLTAVTHLMAGPLKVYSADPAVGTQGETYEVVTIKGQGFAQANAVRFLVTGTSDTGNVGVTFQGAPDEETILVTVSIADDATVADYDIEVQLLSGRKGKGTAKFAVQAKSPGNMQFETCNEVFFGIADGSGPCKSVDGGECQLLLGYPPRIKRMMTDCTTTETLVLPDRVLLTSASAQESGTDRKTLSARDPWAGGSAVITNAGHRAQLGNIDIEIDTGAARGCEFSPGSLLSAVSFALNAATDPPYDPEDESTYDDRASILQVDGVYVSTGLSGGPLCAAVELIRDPSYTAAYPEPQYLNINDWKVRVTGGRIEQGAYVDTAISLQGFKQQQDINPPTVSGNTIFAPACVAGDQAFGIVHGPLIARDNAVPQSEALLENNTIIMSGSKCETMGILLLGGTDTETAANINSNYIAGATYGVVIDGTLGDDSANLKGNTLTGGDGSLVGICSNIPFSEKGKPNHISGFDTPEADNCSP